MTTWPPPQSQQDSSRWGRQGLWGLRGSGVTSSGDGGQGRWR